MTYFSRPVIGRINPSTTSRNDAGFVQGVRHMMKKLLGAAAVAAVVLAVAPASAARLQGCSGTNLMKTETSVEAMADGDAKWGAFKEMTDAQTALLDGKMNVCAAHLTKASQVSAAK
jgi:hypothetical protein